MGDLSKKYLNFSKAVLSIDKLAAHFDYENDILRDALIQRFEFTLEICWRMLRLYLIDQGTINVNSPKSVLREAYACHLISDEKIWIDMVEDRNLTSHVYDEEVAKEISRHIVDSYLPLYKKLLTELKLLVI